MQPTSRRPEPIPAWLRHGAASGLLLLTLLLQGCLAGSRGPDPFAATRDDGPVVLQVQNQNFLDARIYVLWNGQRERAGFVVGLTTETFRFERRQGTLRVQVDFIAGGGFTTDAIGVWPGEVVELVIPPA